MRDNLRDHFREGKPGTKIASGEWRDYFLARDIEMARTALMLGGVPYVCRFEHEDHGRSGRGDHLQLDRDPFPPKQLPLFTKTLHT